MQMGSQSRQAVEDIESDSSLHAGDPVAINNQLQGGIAKKPGLVATNTSSYRPISNLSVLSRLCRLVVRCSYPSATDLIPPLQSGFEYSATEVFEYLRVRDTMFYKKYPPPLRVLLTCLQIETSSNLSDFDINF